jgi:hypothetical protein
MKLIKQSLHSVFQKRNKPIENFMIENFIDSALIIDDKSSEVEALIALLESKQVLTKYYTPKFLQENTITIKNRKLIFLDLYINEDESKSTGQIALIRQIFKKCIGKGFGTYGIVLWTKHLKENGEISPDFKEFLDKFKNNNDEYELPLFIVGLDKAKYLTAGNFNDVLSDLDKELSNNSAAAFFIEWDSLVRKGTANAIINIFSLVKNYNKQEQDLRFILLKLAQNYTGIPTDKLSGYHLEHDAIKAFSDMLHYEITSSYSTNLNLLSNPSSITFSGSPDEANRIYAELNSKLHLDFTNINQAIVMPGNIYEIIESANSFNIDEITYKESKKLITKKIDTLFKNIKRVIIEVTPPCDFANKKNGNRSRIISGIICDLDFHHRDYFQGENYYTEVFPIKIFGNEIIKILVFDFRYFASIDESLLKDSGKYKIIGKSKDKLFADILQKLSSHIARLGLPIIH